MELASAGVRTADRSFDMDGWLERTRLVVCVGAGGVGKTTTAATIGLCGALRGRRALVLTIDPARRLANSIGLREFGNEETRIDLQSLGLEWAWRLLMEPRRMWRRYLLTNCEYAWLAAGELLRRRGAALRALR